MAEALVFSDRPSAKASFPGGVTVTRCYDRLEVIRETTALEKTELSETLELPQLGLQVTAAPAEAILNTSDTFTVVPQGTIFLRPRQSGDQLRLPGGTKSLKKILIDRKIPASQRDRIPVIADDGGILGVYGIGPNLDRAAQDLPAVTIRFIKTDKGE